MKQKKRDRPHAATRHDAGTGQGTVHDPHYEWSTLDHPVLDGSTESKRAQAKVENVYRGVEDPSFVHGIRKHGLGVADPPSGVRGLRPN
ncbi:hypothetical protein [Leucobacter iarius]|uniref:Uncharacterized protein n=1 Tax=Leucobacter iarius TaxID=333963 RepID=A0ABP4XDA6_9MICO